MHTTIPFMDGLSSEMSERKKQPIQNRSIIVDTHAFGSFRKDLIHNIGLERTKGFLFRYGWDMGMRDAKECKEKERYHTIEELIEYGPATHSMKGYVESKTLKLIISNENNLLTLQMESAWENSYEADEHLNQIGVSSGPVCYTLSGYASGFVTGVFGEMIIFKEICCRGAGSSECLAVGKSLSLWGNEIKDELYYLEETPILEELELTYEKLLQERDHLTTTNDIYKRLIEEVMKGKNLESIVQDIHELIMLPVVIHTVHGQPIAIAGFTSLSKEFTSELFQYINENGQKNYAQTLQTIYCQHESFLLLTYPIYLQGKLMGYCSFVFKDHQNDNQEKMYMMIEKVSSVCSLCLFYEKTKLDSFEPMKSFFFKEILSGHFSSQEEIIAKASLFHLDLTEPFYISMISYTINSHNFSSELELDNEIMAAISHYFIQQKQNFLINQNGNHITLLINDHHQTICKNSFFEELKQFLQAEFSNTHFYMGVSKRTESIMEAPNAYKEALVAKRLISKNKQIIFSDSLGVVGALINEHNENEIRLMAKSLLGNIQINCQKNIDLIQTLYSFLLNGGNLEKTADELSLSISGLRYRIHKIEELLQNDIRSPIISCQLLMSIQALIILGELDMKVPVM